MMNCVKLKYRTKKRIRYMYCIKLRKEVNYSDCNNCPHKEFKQYKQLQSKSEYKYKPKRGKCNRYYNNVSIMPKSPYYSTVKIKGCSKHHIFGSVANRPKSEKYGLFVWMTEEQHRYLHEHPLKMKAIKKEAQKSFMKYCDKTIEDFIEIFGRSVL